MRERIWGLLLRLTPKRGTGPIWHILFSYWDDAAGCGCWNASGRTHRWQK